MRKCRNGWHRYDGKGFGQVCSKCVLGIKHPTLRRFNELLLRTQRGRLVREELLPDLHEEVSSVSMRRRQRIEADYRQAVWLLKDDLVWSGDFDNIRYELMMLIEASIKSDNFPENLTAIVQKLIAEENDLSI